MSLDTSSSALHLNLPAASNAQRSVEGFLLSEPELTYSRPPTQITVHPSVVATILTHHTRRPEESTAPRVIGTLMGSRSEDGQEIDVRSCFAVPHSESEDQIAVDMPFQQGMMEMLRKNGTNEQIVGW
jgi:translation initiation factor 3 subunit F